MFKKTLLAMTIASASLSATAGILTFDVTETAATHGAFVNPGAGAADCAEIASDYDATVDLNGQTPADAQADTVTLAADPGAAGEYETTANTLVYTGAAACTLTINQDVLVPASNATYSAEGAAANGVTINATLISGVGGFTNEDTIILTVTGGVVDEDASAGATLTGGAGSAFTLLGVVGNTILFTVDTGTQTAREIVDIAGVVVTANDGASALSVSAATQNTANVQYDQTPAAELVVLETQYSSSVEALFDGIIDVATERLTLAVNTDDSLNDQNTANIGVQALNQDTTVIKVTENTANGNLASDHVELVINGDFSWMAQLDTSDDDTAITSAELAAGFVYDSHIDDTLAGDGDDVFDSVAVNEDWNKLTVTIDSSAGTEDVDAYHTFQWAVPGATGETSLNEQTFTGSVTSVDADDNEAVIAPAMTALGEWSLNGSVVEVPYLPFGPNTQPILRHTNTGVQTGDIAVRYMVEGEHTTWQSLGVMVEDAEPGLHNLLGPVTAALKAAGYDRDAGGFKVALEVTTNVPGGDVTVFAAAKITTTDSDRLSVGAFN